MIIVNYRTPKLTTACLSALRNEKSAFDNFRVVVVDGGSPDSSAEHLSAWVNQPEFRDWVDFVPLPLNGGFGWANNQAIQRLIARAQQPEYIHLLNPDTEIEPGAVRFLVDYLNDHPVVGAVGSQLLEFDGSWTGSAFSFPTVRGEFSRGARTAVFDRILRVRPVAVAPTSATEVDWATGASVMFRSAALLEVGLFDEGFFLYHEEIELMWRLRKAGWTIAFEPRSRVRHVGGGSTGVHNRGVPGPLEQRRPPYWYRSRSRYFGLTGGAMVAMGAFLSWILGHGLWRVRRLAGLAVNLKPFDHQFRDHLAKAFPRGHDMMSAVEPANGVPNEGPAWMKNGWL